MQDVSACEGRMPRPSTMLFVYLGQPSGLTTQVRKADHRFIHRRIDSPLSRTAGNLFNR